MACRAVGGSRSIARGWGDGNAGGVCEVRIDVFWSGLDWRITRIGELRSRRILDLWWHG